MGIKETLFVIAKSAGISGISDELAREQYRLLCRQVPIMYGVIVVNSLFMAITLLADVGYFKAFIFPALILPSVVWRTILWQKRKKTAETEGIDNIRRALRGNVITAGISASLLSLWAVVALYSASPQYWPFIPLFTILSMITCAYCLMALPAATYIILLTGTTYVVGTLWSLNNPVLLSMAANIAIISMLLVYMTANQFGQLRWLVDSRRKLVSQRAYSDRLARHDPLTDMPNRRAFLEALSQTAEDRPSRSVAVIMIDMNGFKPINDTYGHSVGDRLLTTVGQCLTLVAGKKAIVARLGGDEFAVLFPAPHSPKQIEKIAQSMLYEIAKPITIDLHEIRVGAAFGITYCKHMPADPMELIKHADIALYEAKKCRLSAIRFFEGDMEGRVRRRTLVEQALSDTQQMNAITLHFQPIFSMRDGVHVGFEALARWQHPILGEISPHEFVSAAEQNGLATTLTVHLFRQALLTAREWDDDLRLSFNLSGSGLGTSNLDNILPTILSEMQFDPARLSVEITETALLGDLETAQSILMKIRALGVQIILDDFGAGYASIGYLREMNFDGIKLDGNLINSITHNEKSRNLLIGVLHLCRAINAEVTAEMVETKEQLALLRTLPIANVQGYLLGRPVPAAETLAADPSKHALRQQLFGT